MTERYINTPKASEDANKLPTNDIILEKNAITKINEIIVSNLMSFFDDSSVINLGKPLLVVQ